MKFPRSMREINTLIAPHMARMRNINAPKPDLQQTAMTNNLSGTVAAPYMGHQMHPPYNLYQSSDVTQYDYGDGPQMTPPHDANQRITTWPWPANAARWEGSGGGGRSEQFIASDLNTGPAPGRILRQMYERNHGNDNAMTGTNVGSGTSLPYGESWSYMPHLKVPRKALGTKGPQKLSDDNAVIPALFSGNPRP